MRIYELAKKLGVKSNVILFELSKLGIEGKKHSSNIDSTLVKQLEDVLRKMPECPAFQVGMNGYFFRKTQRGFAPLNPQRNKILSGGIDRKEFDKKEVLQEFKKIIKERLSEYQKYKMPISTIEYINLFDDNNNDQIPHNEEIEKPILVNDEVLNTDPPTISTQINDMKDEKREDYRDRRAVIAALILSAIFIIGVMFMTLINYVWRDRTYEIRETKSSKLPVQKQYQYPIQLFTIQAGAFRDAYFAKSLMNRLSKKGYPAFITTSYLKEKRFYKVFIGKFTERTDAEEMCLKIKRTEGLQTFITLWERQDSGPTSYKTPSYYPI
ncbi:MAG: translation initiation factor IF-2 N-terminal domain-containing protein [Thermodesulfovibrionales bacterium]